MSFKQNNSSNSINISDWKNIIYDFKPKISIIDSDYSIEETLKSQFVKLVILMYFVNIILKIFNSKK